MKRTIPQSLFRDQFTQVSEVNSSSEENPNSTTSVQTIESNSIDSVGSQPSQTSVTRNSSEIHMDSIISDQDSGPMSPISMRDQSTQVTIDHNSSEDQLSSTRSDQNSQSGSINSMSLDRSQQIIIAQRKIYILMNLHPQLVLMINTEGELISQLDQERFIIKTCKLYTLTFCSKLKYIITLFVDCIQ